MKLPAEIRNQIDRILLRGDGARVYVANQPTKGLGSSQQDDLITNRSPGQGTASDTKETLICLSDEIYPFDLFPEILSTSPQVYDEATNILYDENTFCYALKERHFGSEVNLFRRSEFPRVALRRVRWLRMTIEEEEDKNGKCETELLHGLRQFRSPECSLQGLLLDLGFYFHQFSWCGNQPALMQFVLEGDRFMSAVLALKDLKKIQIHAREDTNGYIDHYTCGAIDHYTDWIRSLMIEKNWRGITVDSLYLRWDLVPVDRQTSISAQVPSL